MFLLTNNVEILPDASADFFSFSLHEIALNFWRNFDSYNTQGWQDEEHRRALEIFWAGRQLAEGSLCPFTRNTFGLGHRM